MQVPLNFNNVHWALLRIDFQQLRIEANSAAAFCTTFAVGLRSTATNEAASRFRSQDLTRRHRDPAKLHAQLQPSATEAVIISATAAANANTGTAEMWTVQSVIKRLQRHGH